MREGWVTVKLGEVCAVEKAKYAGDDLPYVGLEHIVSGTGRFIGSSKAQKVGSSTFQFSPKHLLYGRLRPYLNKVLLPEFSGHCSSEIFPILPFNTVDIRFLYYWLTSLTIVEAINSTCTGARMPRANVKEVLQFSFPLPLLGEQKRIAAILDQAFKGIAAATANAEKNLANARELFESYLNSIFSSPNIDGWEWDRLGNAVSSVATGPFGSLLHKSDYISGGTPIVNPINIVDGLLLSSVRKTLNAETVERLNRYVLKSGDVVIARRGEIGRCGVVEHEQNGWVCGTGCFFIQQSERLNSRFLVCLLRSFSFRLKLEKSATGATMKNLSNSTLKNLDVCFPWAVDEQTAVVSRVDTLSEKVAELEAVYNKKLTALTELKQSLLQKAFSGELTAGDADIKEESVA